MNARLVAARLGSAAFSDFDMLAVVKLARLNGVAHVTKFTGFECRRLDRVAKITGWVARCRTSEGKSFEMRAAGWKALNKVEDALKLEETK